jgi:light-regulated signal transduction histidine kinase (bacteriophytochrome)
MLFALSIILFEEDKVRYKMLLLAAVSFIIVLCLKNVVEPLVSYENPFRSVIHLLLSMVVVFYAIRSYTTVTESESRTKDLLLDKIKEQNLELERFAYITSHDLKQPVRNICNFSSLLERNLKSNNDTNKSIEYLDIIKKSSRNIEKLIDDILKYSRIDQVNENLEIVDLNEILNRQKENLRYILDAKNASIIYDHLPKMKGNNVYLSLLLQNLIENGIKYNRSERPEVNISVEQDATSFKITITDNGIGIDQSYFEEIFQPFKRLHSNREFEGSGLGLSICNKIVEKHDGQLSVNSIPDQGTTFNIIFPEQYLI